MLKQFWDETEDVVAALQDVPPANVLPLPLAHPEAAHGNTKLHQAVLAHLVPCCTDPDNHSLEHGLQEQDGLERLPELERNLSLNNFGTGKPKLVVDSHLPNKNSRVVFPF